MSSAVKHNYRNILLVLVCMTCLPLSSFAVNSPIRTECPKNKKNQKDSLNIVSESDTKVLKVEPQLLDKKPLAKSNIPIRTTHKTFEDELEESKGADEDPNSAMSFNFIYYIIDKFKFTDPLE